MEQKSNKLCAHYSLRVQWKNVHFRLDVLKCSI